MRLPFDLLSQNYTKPNIYLCEADKKRICRLETMETHATLRFNSYSELECTVSREYEDIISGEYKVNPFYDKIEALRLLYVEGFGYFEIQDPEVFSDGFQETKSITAYSLEYSLSQKYLEDLYINTGKNNSVEVVYANDANLDNQITHEEIKKVVLYNPSAFTEYDKKHSLLHLVLEKIYGWSIAHVDPVLQTMTRTFEVSRASVYDFIMQDICDKFNCFVVFDTINNEIYFYAESPIVKFKGDNETTVFKIDPAFEEIESVSINSYKTTKWTYEVIEENKKKVGILTFEEKPADNADIEVVDGSQKKYETDVYVSFNNLVQEVSVSYSADDIKTVLTVKGADDLDIREVNSGLAYITDLSYYYSVDWMGKELYDAYDAYAKRCKEVQDDYIKNTEEILKNNNEISYEESRYSLQYSVVHNVTPETTGTYYVRAGTEPNYDYIEVQLPDDYSANVDHYYMLSDNRLNETKFESFYEAIKSYYLSQDDKDTSELAKLKEDFAFMEINTIDSLINNLSKANTTAAKDSAINTFLNELWDQVGLTPLDEYLTIYKGIKKTNEEAGWNNTSSTDYWAYYPVNIVIASLEKDIKDRNDRINELKKENEVYYAKNSKITREILMDIFFVSYYTEQGIGVVKNGYLTNTVIGTYYVIKPEDEATGNYYLCDGSDEENKTYYVEVSLPKEFDRETVYYSIDEAKKKANDLLVRLNPFLREDEYTDDSFIVTDADSIETSIQVKKELLECGKIELEKLSAPKLQFSMDIANIYAMQELAPLVDHFQLGKLINIKIREAQTETFYVIGDGVTKEFEAPSSYDGIKNASVEVEKYDAQAGTIEFKQAPDKDVKVEVVLAKYYIKRSRLLEININFDDLSDFSCEFGELIGLRTQSSIHADLLANAMSASKSVSSNASYWDKGADLATSTDIKIQQGLLSATNGLYNSDQSLRIDENGILLRQVNEDGSFSPYQAWLRNNTILLSSDGFAAGTTPRTGLGEFTIDGTTFYGILAEAVLSGYIEGSRIVGGTINIGDGTFVVNENGSVVMNAASIDGYVEEDGIISSINQSPESIAINANRISLAGKTIDLTSDNIIIDSTNFSVDKTGKITATSGSIAGWEIYPGLFRKAMTINGVDYQICMQSTDGVNTSNAFYIRKKNSSDTSWDYQFFVNYAGKLTAKNADITGAITATSLSLGSEVTIPYSKLSGTPNLSVYIAKDGTVGSTPSSGSTGFKVSSNGLLTASNAVIYGTIYASAGTIAGYNIGSGGTFGNALYKRVSGDSDDYEVGLKASSGSADIAFYVKKSSDNWSSSSDVFYVNNSGKLYAQNANITGTITATDGEIAGYNIGSGGTYNNALYKRVTGDTAKYEVGLKASSGDTDLAFYVKKSTDNWDSSSNVFYVNNSGKLYAQNVDITGEINASSGNISGNLNISGALVNTNGDYSVTLRGVQDNKAYGVFYISDNSSDTTTYPVRINGDGSASFTNVTISGNSTIASACIPNLSAAKITSGTFDPVLIPNLSANKITSGTLDPLVLDASVITTGNFSSKTLSTGNLSVTNGGNIGIWTVNSNNYLYAISGSYGVSLSATSVSHGQGGSATWASIVLAGQNASDQRLKKNILELDDKFDKVFDNLKPVQFEYSKDTLGKGKRFGYIAQDVINAMENEGENVDDYSFIYETEIEDGSEDKYYQLNKADFIALNTWQIQKLKDRVAELEKKIEELKG